MDNKITTSLNLYSEIAKLLVSARNQVVSTVNRTMTKCYFEIGKLIIENEQKGKKRAEYGKKSLIDISEKLKKNFGKGFSVQNLERMRNFYHLWKKSSTVSRKLSWSHYVYLLSISNTEERKFYEIECSENNWSLRELDRQFNSSLYERIALSRNKKGVKLLGQKGQIVEKPEDVLKDPYVLEFLGLDENHKYNESEMEEAIITNIQKFLLELGKGFSFVSRQKRFSFGPDHFFIDLVFYNRILKCFVLIDLKIGKLKHQNIGQMQMYVNIYDREVRKSEENPTVGLILCKEKNEIIVEYTLPKNNNQIFARKYQLYLPTKKELQKEIAKITN